MTDKLDSAKDGFDLIDYPCDYQFKAMGKVASGVDFHKEMRKLAEQVVAPGAVLSITSASSRTGKFESVSMMVTLQNREQLESIYHQISELDWVVMSL